MIFQGNQGLSGHVRGGVRNDYRVWLAYTIFLPRAFKLVSKRVKAPGIAKAEPSFLRSAGIKQVGSKVPPGTPTLRATLPSRSASVGGATLGVCEGSVAGG